MLGLLHGGDAAGVLLLLAPALLHWSVPTASASLLILLMGLVSAVCHMLVITAFRLAEASLLAPLVYLELLGGTLLGLLLFGQFPAPATWLGIALIVAAGLILIERRPQAEQRSPLGFEHVNMLGRYADTFPDADCSPRRRLNRSFGSAATRGPCI